MAKIIKMVKKKLLIIKNGGHKKKMNSQCACGDGAKFKGDVRNNRTSSR